MTPPRINLAAHLCYDRCVRLYSNALRDWNASGAIQNAAATLGMDERAYCDARLTVSARVIVCGSRGWHDRKLIADTLNALVLERGYRFPDPLIVHGAARGADRLAEEEAGKAGLLTETHPADWERHGKRAGLIRNEEMAALGADLCVAFWDGKSTGTQHMMETAARHGIDVRIVTRHSLSPAAVGGES